MSASQMSSIRSGYMHRANSRTRDLEIFLVLVTVLEEKGAD